MANFSYGVIAAVGVLVTVSLGFIVMMPDEVIKDRTPSIVLFSVPDTLPDNQTAPAIDESVSDDPQTVSIPVGTSVPGCEADNMCYVPYDLTITPGTTVSWVVDDTAAHTVTSGSPSDGPSDLFDSGLVLTDDVFEYTFDEAGTFEYYCIVHPWMLGVITVS